MKPVFLQRMALNNKLAMFTSMFCLKDTYLNDEGQILINILLAPRGKLNLSKVSNINLEKKHLLVYLYIDFPIFVISPLLILASLCRFNICNNNRLGSMKSYLHSKHLLFLQKKDYVENFSKCKLVIAEFCIIRNTPKHYISLGMQIVRRWRYMSI